MAKYFLTYGRAGGKTRLFAEMMVDHTKVYEKDGEIRCEIPGADIRNRSVVIKALVKLGYKPVTCGTDRRVNGDWFGWVVAHKEDDSCES